MSGSWASAPPAGGRHERTFPPWRRVGRSGARWPDRELRRFGAGRERRLRRARYQSVSELARAVDLVLVAVKVPRHRELILPALELGVPVLSEWPLGLDLREAEALERAARGTRAFVGLQGRSSPTFRWLADLVADGSVGEVLSATVSASTEGWGAAGVRAHAVHARSPERGDAADDRVRTRDRRGDEGRRRVRGAWWRRPLRGGRRSPSPTPRAPPR